ncbi:MAG: hypothetical protein WAM14_23575, partial [Candidatus Nitrosopolaris sp.]
FAIRSFFMFLCFTFYSSKQVTLPSKHVVFTRVSPIGIQHFFVLALRNLYYHPAISFSPIILVGLILTRKKKEKKLLKGSEKIGLLS